MLWVSLTESIWGMLRWMKKITDGALCQLRSEMLHSRDFSAAKQIPPVFR